MECVQMSSCVSLASQSKIHRQSHTTHHPRCRRVPYRRKYPFWLPHQSPPKIKQLQLTVLSCHLLDNFTVIRAAHNANVNARAHCVNHIAHLFANSLRCDEVRFRKRHIIFSIWSVYQSRHCQCSIHIEQDQGGAVAVGGTHERIWKKGEINVFIFYCVSQSLKLLKLVVKKSK